MQVKECEKMYSGIFPFWNHLTNDEKEKLCRYTIESKYKKGTNIHSGYGECIGGVIVKSGCVRTYLLSEDGKEVTLYRLYAGDMCTLSASCVLKEITFDVFVDAESDSECYVINGKAFKELADQNLEIKNFALENTVKRFSDVVWVMQQIMFMSFDKRLAIFLLEEMKKTESDTIKLTQEQIAKYIGSAREVVSRMLKYFSTEGIVEHSRAGVKIVDRNKLIQLVK